MGSWSVLWKLGGFNSLLCCLQAYTMDLTILSHAGSVQKKVVLDFWHSKNIAHVAKRGNS
jgi:hypothetical protein